MRIAVAMSGGVDSSVAALLLKEQGHEVVGLSMRLYDAAGPGRSGRCCTSEDLADARRVAWTLEIPHVVLDLEAEFRDAVVRPFVASYAAGETPIPCTDCNTKVKFAALWTRARAMGCAAVATGHYARTATDPRTGRRLLRKGADPEKDQSYFLWDLTSEQLAAACFPVGDLRKADVRAHARRAGLPTADKEESQEICFVPRGIRAGDFVAARAGELGVPLPVLPGRVEDTSGRPLGTHAGHFRYTIGQRRGLPAASGRRYVVGIDAGSNRIVVGTADDLATAEAEVTGLRFPSGPPDGTFRAGVRIRHRAAEAAASIEPRPDGSARIRFDEPQRAVTPGQSAVFYDGEILLGGGVLRRAAAAPAARAS
jgi:tRNA-specific 2-thiouridylase